MLYDVKYVFVSNIYIIILFLCVFSMYICVYIKNQKSLKCTFELNCVNLLPI